jgi:opacity protein-like surface antigen
MRTNPIQLLTLAVMLLAGTTAGAQILDVHGSVLPSLHSRPMSVGFGVGLGTTRRLGIVNLLPSVGLDYVRARSLGPGRGSAGLDVRLIPSREFGWGAPFIGGSVSSNWSGGEQSEWAGSRLGLDVLAGFVLGGVTSNVGIKIEERFGYVRGQPHTATTRIGLVTLL